MTKILVINSYTWYEKGDAAIIIGMLYVLRQQFPEAEITVLSNTPDIDRKHFLRYDDRLQVFKNLLVAPRNFSRLAKALTYLWQAIEYACLVKLRKPRISRSEALKAYTEANVIISCGGGYLSGHLIASQLLHLYRIWLAKLLKKPVVLFCASVEPCGNTILEKATKFVLNRVDLIIVREELSQVYLKHLGIKTPVFLGADAAFLLPDCPPLETERLLTKEGIYKQAGEILVGISVRGWRFPQYKGQAKKEKVSDYFTVMVETVRHLVSVLGYRVIFFPLVTCYPNDDDRIISHRMAAAIDSDRVMALTGDYSPEELKAMIGGMDLFIAVRLHAAIFATCMGVPTLGIACLNKMNGIMEMLSIDEYVLPVDNLKITDVLSQIDSLRCNRDKIRKALLMNTAKLKSLVISSAQLVRSEIG